MKLPLALLLSLAMLGLGPARTAPAASDWPHWRGPTRNGLAAEASGWSGGPWPASAPLWGVNVGDGGSSPLVVGGKVYAFGWKDNQEQLQCLDLETGKPAWKVSYPAPQYGRHAVGDQNFYSGPGATPEYDPGTGYLYTLGTDGDLNCWDTRKSGGRVWGLNLTTKYRVERRPQATARRGTQRDYGCTSAPLVHGEWLLVEVGAPEGSLMAFSKKTGERAWVSQYQSPAGHSGGLAPITVEGIPCVAVLTLRGLLVARLDPGNEGKTLAEYEWTTDFDCNIPMPAVRGSSVVLTSAYNRQSTCRLDLSLSGVKKVWEQRVHSVVCSPVIHGNHVYFVSSGLNCLDWNTGALKWSGGRFGDSASIVATVDGRLIVWANAGDLALAESAERSPDEYKELAAVHGLGEAEAWPYVVVAGGRALCKDRHGNLKCLPLVKP